MNADYIITVDQLFAMGIMYGGGDFTTFTMLGDAQLPGQVMELYVDDRLAGTEDDYIGCPERSKETRSGNRNQTVELR